MKSVFPLLLVSLILILLPTMVGNEFYVNLASQVLIYALLAMSLNILVGLGGMVSLGHAAYLGVAAYADAWLVTNAGTDALSAAFIAVAVTTAMAALFGVLALRAAGLGFVMITLALAQILWGLGYRWADLTGGDNGIRLASRPAPFGIDLASAAHFYYFTFVVFTVAFVCLWRLSRSPFGAALRGARDQPRRMRMLGHHVWMVRWMAFIMAGFWGSIAGLLFVYYNQFIHPHSLSLQQSAEALLMVILGGANTFLGPIVGALVITLVKNVASSYVDRWNSLLGLIFVVVVLFMPQGLVPGFKLRWTQFTARGRKVLVAAPAPPSP
jgi:branched-chain amino acid transport system permease protein